jgi:energy-coupling factor transport system ATP-binding protein
MIELKNVWFKYDDKPILKNITLQIREGELICILGDNGAGKTTLAKHLNGLLKPYRGDVYVDGDNTRDTPVSELSRKVALVFQYPEKMLFTSSLIEEVSFALRNFGYREEVINRQVEKVLKMFWLWNYRERSPFTLSGGEQRRLALAIVLAWDPKYIVMDEPTAGQDAYQREILMGVIRELVRRGKTVILITHDIEFVFEFESRIILLKDGEILFDGPSHELFNNRVELLEEAGLDKPSLIKLKDILNDKGYNIRFNSYDDAVNKIYEIIKGSENV